MRGSAELRPSKLGLAFPLLIAAALIAGRIRGELVLTLTGALLLTVFAYCLLAVLLPALINGKKARSLSARIAGGITGGPLNPGDRGEAFLPREGAAGGRFFHLPALLVRYELRIASRDGRTIRHTFDPDILKDGFSVFTAGERGAYYDQGDRLSFCDMPGLFRFSWKLASAAEGPRLLVAPRLPPEAVPLPSRSGGTEHLREHSFQRSDDLTSHRPYISGDDPRRINWKLYGHAGDLFVREGEPEPPPHGRLLIMVDPQADGALFAPEKGRQGVDLLCETALAAALAYREQGLEVHIAHTGGIFRGGDAGELAAALAWPAALPLLRQAAPQDYPPITGEQGLLILALPRSSTEEGALERYLKKKPPRIEADLVFLYRGEELDGPAETCAALYGRRPGLHARRLRLD